MSIKDQLLAYFKDRRGDWVSGEVLSNKMGVSRSAVWKQVRKLRAEGYVIDSSPKKGYAFQVSSPDLLPSEIRHGLATTVLGQGDIFHFEVIDSTNIKARELAAQGAREGTLVVAEGQTKGRGRMARRWFSPLRAGIYVSLILRPNIAPADAPKLTLLTGVALAEAIRSVTGLKVRIKWPNDILFQRKKLGGILTEMSAEMDSIDYVVVGTGVNVNIPKFPEEIREKATSIFVEAGRPFSRLALLQEYLRRYEEHYKGFIRDGFAPIRERWKDLCDMVGRHVLIDMLDKKYEGSVEGIDNDGALLLKDREGKTQRIFSGEVAQMSGGVCGE